MQKNEQRDSQTARLHANAKVARLQAIESQLALGTTLCELAETEIRLGEVATAQRLAGKLQHSAKIIGFHLSEPEHIPETSVDLRGHLLQLETRLQKIEAQLARFGNTPAKQAVHL